METTKNIMNETATIKVPLKDRLKPFWSKAKIWSCKAFVAMDKGVKKSIQTTKRACRVIVRSAVELSIIAIAAIMIYEFLGAHPEVVDFLTGLWETIEDGFQTAFDAVMGLFSTSGAK